MNADQDLELAKRSAAQLGMPGTQLWAGPKGTEGPMPAALQVPSWPFFLLVDADGVVRWRSYRFDGLPETAARWVDAAEASARASQAGTRGK